MKTVKEKLTDLGLIDRLAETPFEQYFEWNTLNLSPVLIYSLLLRKIDPTKMGEIHFRLENKRVRFGRFEYVLICGLAMEDGPMTAEQDERKGDRLITDYLNDVSNAKFDVLLNTLKTFNIRTMLTSLVCVCLLWAD